METILLWTGSAFEVFRRPDRLFATRRLVPWRQFRQPESLSLLHMHSKLESTVRPSRVKKCPRNRGNFNTRRVDDLVHRHWAIESAHATVVRWEGYRVEAAEAAMTAKAVKG